jgi:hypothetical protein
VKDRVPALERSHTRIGEFTSLPLILTPRVALKFSPFWDYLWL